MQDQQTKLFSIAGGTKAAECGSWKCYPQDGLAEIVYDDGAAAPRIAGFRLISVSAIRSANAGGPAIAVMAATSGSAGFKVLVWRLLFGNFGPLSPTAGWEAMGDAYSRCGGSWKEYWLCGIGGNRYALAKFRRIEGYCRAGLVDCSGGPYGISGCL